MPNFELVSKYADQVELLPTRSTKESAGYDLFAAEDIIIDPWIRQSTKLAIAAGGSEEPRTLDEVAKLTKNLGAKPTLVPTGVKCRLESGTYLEISVRSSTPLKYWIILANGVGIIDADYYNNPDNEGLIYLQLINLSPFPIYIKKGDKIGQGIIHHYEITDNDIADGKRIGGFGSTGV